MRSDAVFSGADAEVSPLHLPPDFAQALKLARAAVEAYLRGSLEEDVAACARRSPAAGQVAEAVRMLTLQGGKRFRPLLLLVAYGGMQGHSEEDVLPACDEALPAAAALELLQSYFLIHDDWMDGDATRRGGPTAHVWLRAQVGDIHLGDSLGIMAGDLACAWAQRMVAQTAIPSERVHAALLELSLIQADVLQGQVLDITAGVSLPTDQADAREAALAQQELLYHLKTGRYTVGGPLRLGALLAGASSEALAALEAFAAPLGVAFQLRDDLLDLFGREAEIGKPVGSDLRSGKRTCIVIEARQDPVLWAKVEPVFGHSDCSAQALEEALELLSRHPSRGVVEARLLTLCQEALRALEVLPIHPAARSILRGAVEALGWRQR